MSVLEQRVSRLEGTLPPHDGDPEPDLVRVYASEDGSEERLDMYRRIVLRTERAGPDGG